MKTETKKINDTKVELTVDVDEKDWKAAQEKAFAKLAANVQIDGFRKGHAPLAQAKKHINPSQALDEAINTILPTVYGQAVTEAKLRPFFQPKIDVTKVSDTELQFKFTVTLAPEVTLGKYKGLHADKDSTEVSEKEISDAINAKLAGAADLVVVEREAKLGDTVVLDFEGFIDGKAFEGGKAENYSLELGSNSFVPGFEDALVGVKTGDSKDVNITFPENYVKELAGKPATFKCVIHEIKEKKVPELTDEAVKDLAIKGVETVDQLKENTKTELTNSKTAAAQRKYFEALITMIRDDAKVTIDDEIIDNEAKQMEENMKQKITSQGLEFQQYLDITGKKLEDLQKELKVEAEKNIKTLLCLDKIGQVEAIVVSDTDFESELGNMAKQYNMSVEDIKKALGNSLAQFRSNLRDKKIQDFILANNK